jgi:hypothetical protein
MLDLVFDPRRTGSTHRHFIQLDDMLVGQETRKKKRQRKKMENVDNTQRWINL